MSRRIDKLLIDAKTAQNEAGYLNVSDAAQLVESAFYIEFDGTSAAGQVLIETASDINYAGTWAILATVNWAAINKSHYVAITGALRALRARISTAVTSGTVTVRMVGNING